MEKRWFWILVIMAALPILIGVVDWLAGYFSRHAMWMFWIGLAILAALGIFDGIRRLRRRKDASFTLPLLICVLTFTAASAAFPAMEGEVAKMPSGGTLNYLAVACGHPASSWPLIWAENKWIPLKRGRNGQIVAKVYPGQPVNLPDGWKVQNQESESGDADSDTDITKFAGVIWADFCDMAKNYPVSFFLLVIVIIAAITARSVADERRKYRRESMSVAEPETTRSSRYQRDQWESVLLPR